MARAIMAGVSLGIFDALDEEPDDADRLARRLQLDPRGIDILLVALHALEYVEHRGDGVYRNSPAVEKFALRDSPQSLRAYLGDFNGDMWNEFSRTDDALRTGETSGLHAARPGRPLLGALHARSLRPDPSVRRRGGQDDSRPGTRSGCSTWPAGTAATRSRCAVATPSWRSRSSSSRAPRASAGRSCGSRAWKTGSTSSSATCSARRLGEGYDVATAFQILHHFDEDVNVELLTRAREALRDGGTVAILEQERPPTGQRGSTIGALTGLLFYVTSRARTYTADELPRSSKRRASTGCASGARCASRGT